MQCWKAGNCTLASSQAYIENDYYWRWYYATHSKKAMILKSPYLLQNLYHPTYVIINSDTPIRTKKTSGLYGLIPRPPFSRINTLSRGTPMVAIICCDCRHIKDCKTMYIIYLRNGAGYVWGGVGGGGFPMSYTLSTPGRLECKMVGGRGSVKRGSRYLPHTRNMYNYVRM